MQARRLTAQEGILWLYAGLRIYRANPPLMITLTFSYLFMMLGISMIPVVGTIAANLGLPFLVVMVANGCRAIDEGHSRPLPASVLIDGLAHHRPALLTLGGINLVGSVIALIVGRGISNALGAPDSLEPGQSSPLDVLKVMGPPFLISVPMLLAFWFSPLLTAWQGVPPAKSLFFSFAACMRNWPAFGAFGGTALTLGLVVPGLLLAIPAMLLPVLAGVLSIILGAALMFVLAPVLMTSIYVGYRDIFLNE